MTINIFMHIYIGENAHWDIYAPPGKSITRFFFSNFFFFFFHFRCILLQISHQKCFFISISIPGRSGVKIVKYCGVGGGGAKILQKVMPAAPTPPPPPPPPHTLCQ